MEELYLKITQDDRSVFFSLYDLLSPKRKEIFSVSVSFCRRYNAAYPSQKKIAELCNCSRSAVSEAFQIFKRYGWLTLIHRGRGRTKLLSIPLYIQAIDLVNREYFRSIEATSKATHTYSNYRKETSRVTSEIKIPSYLSNLKISYKNKLKLSLVSEHIYQESLYQCQKRSSQGMTFRNAENYLVGMAINKSKQSGHKLNWRSYYNTLKRSPSLMY